MGKNSKKNKKKVAGGGGPEQQSSRSHSTRVRDKTIEGMTLLMNNHLQEAMNLFHSQAGVDASGAEAKGANVNVTTAETSVFLLGAALAQFLMAACVRGEEDLQNSIASSWRAEAVARDVKDNPLGNMVQADTHLLASLAQFMRGDRVKGAWNLRKSWKYYESSLAELNEYGGADKEELLGHCRFGAGFFSLVVSLLPASILTIAQWIGFSGHRKRGLEMLHASMNTKCMASPLAALMLLMHYTLISTFTGEQTPALLAEADKILLWSRNKYKRGALFMFFETKLLRCRGQNRAAIEQGAIGLEQCAQHPDIRYAFQLLFHYERGWSALILMAYADAALFLQPMIDDSAGEDMAARPTLRPFYSYQIGLCLLMCGQEDEARKRFAAVESLLSNKVPARPLELYAVRKAKQFLDRQGDPILDVLELLLVWEGFSQMDSDSLLHTFSLLDAAARYHQCKYEWGKCYGGDAATTPVSLSLWLNKDAAASPSDADSTVVATVAEAETKNETDVDDATEEKKEPSLRSVKEPPTVAELIDSWSSAGAWNADDGGLWCRYHVLRGAMLCALAKDGSNNAEADKCFQKVIDWESSLSKKDKKAQSYLDGVGPLAHYQRAKLLLARDELVEAEKEQAISAKSDGYELFRALQFRLHSLAHAINNRKAELADTGS